MFKKKKLNKDNLELKRKYDELDITTNIEIQTNKMVIKKASFISRTLEIFLDFIYRLGKILFWAALCIVLSIGAMAIINPEIRSIFINYLSL